MKRTVTAVVAATTLAVAAVATPNTADARREYHAADSLYSGDPYLNAAHAIFLIGIGDTEPARSLIARARSSERRRISSTFGAAVGAEVVAIRLPPTVRGRADHIAARRATPMAASYNRKSLAMFAPTAFRALPAASPSSRRSR